VPKLGSACGRRASGRESLTRDVSQYHRVLMMTALYAHAVLLLASSLALAQADTLPRAHSTCACAGGRDVGQPPLGSSTFRAP